MSTPQRPTKPLPQESAALLRSLTDHVNDESLQTLFNEVDSDNSGLVELEEVTDLLGTREYFFNS
jgi:Ca2+-binding EF-hand superfamily protein